MHRRKDPLVHVVRACLLRSSLRVFGFRVKGLGFRAYFRSSGFRAVDLENQGT